MLEMRVLNTLLRRYHCQHHRASYFQRLSMFVRCVERNSLTSLDAVTRDVSRWRRSSTTSTTEPPPDGRELELGPDGGLRPCEGRTAPPPPLRDDEGDDVARRRSATARRARWLHGVLSRYLPEALDRARRCCEAFWVETSRGFFLPLGTVAVASVARVRSILLRYARTAVEECAALAARTTTERDGGRVDVLTATATSSCVVASRLASNFAEVDPSWQPSKRRRRRGATDAPAAVMTDAPVVAGEEDVGEELGSTATTPVAVAIVDRETTTNDRERRKRVETDAGSRAPTRTKRRNTEADRAKKRDVAARARRPIVVPASPERSPKRTSRPRADDGASAEPDANKKRKSKPKPKKKKKKKCSTDFFDDIFDGL